MTDTSRPTNPPPSSGARRIWLSLLVLVVVAGGIAWGGYWYLLGRHHVFTDDAYVSGDIVQITSEVPGTVITLHADNTQLVARDQPLLELDPADADVAMASAEANLAQAVRQVRTQFAQADQLRAVIAEREATLSRAQHDYQRRLELIGAGGISREDLSHTRDDIAELGASVDAARADFMATEVQIVGTTVPTHPVVRAAAARLRDAALALRRSRITAPIDGVIAKRTVEVGQHVDPGTALMAIIPLRDLWIDANFKEVQLEHLRIGQPAIVHADVYGNDVVYHGRVAGVAAGSGSTFSLLPAQNATGNWIKIVQRIPVRILLDPAELQAHPLRLGLSTTVDIDITGATNATPVRNYALPNRNSDGDDPTTASLISRIIAENSASAEVAKEVLP